MMSNEEKGNLFRQLSKRIIKEEHINSSEVLHDYKGRLYQVSDEYYSQQVLKRTSHDTFKRQKARQLIDDGFKMLTVQQQRVMKLVIKGLTEKAISDKLGISHQRVNRIKKASAKKLRNYIPSIQEEE